MLPHNYLSLSLSSIMGKNDYAFKCVFNVHVFFKKQCSRRKVVGDHFKNRLFLRLGYCVQ